ncbi:MAG: methyltransferase domain-containing protein [Verrucomicrobia bacterium]|nr:methyltransferase domain-containing protein [Verrucomicrobiota bacterium]
MNDTTLFVQEWLANPLRTGAIAPSSRMLAAAMACWLPTDPDSFVLELGPGTGAVTQALLQRGLREDRLVAIERNPKMAAVLHRRFPRAHIITGDAWHMDTLLRDHAEEIHSVGAVISSLPLLNFPPAEADALEKTICAILQPAGRFVQYSYHLGKPQPRGNGHFQPVASTIVWRNLPPARVSVYQK